MKKTPEDLIADIKQACDLLGWRVALCETDDEIHGLVVGNMEYIEETVGQLANLDEYTISASDDEASSDLH